MTDQPDDIVLTMLRAIREDMTNIKQTLAEHSQQFIALRKQVHSVEGDVLRIEESFARVDLRLERLEKRSGLLDAE